MKIETQLERAIVGIECRASNDDPQSIGAVWQRFMAEQLAEKIANRADGKLIAVYCDYEGDHTKPYTFFLGCVVDRIADLPNGFSSRRIPGGRYVKRRAVGEMPHALVKEWTSIWESSLDRSFIADFEIHDPKSPESVDIFIGID